jgi:hypothetical protein
MKLKYALIAYNCNSDQIEVGPLLSDDVSDWTTPYRMTHGAAFTAVRQMDGKDAALRAYADFVGAVVRDSVDLQAAFKAFYQIDEFRDYLPFDMLTFSDQQEADDA